MTEPVRVGELLPGVLAEVVDRAGHGYDRWAELVAQTGYCHPPGPAARPGRARRPPDRRGPHRLLDRPGAGRHPAQGVRQPAGVGAARPARRPTRPTASSSSPLACEGGKGVPETVGRPSAAVRDLHRPTFGRVHSRKAQGRLVFPCHPYRQGQRCPHGRRAGCWQRHDEDDPRLGEPLCPRCYQAGAQVLWNALARRLWSRTTIYRPSGARPARRPAARPSCGGWSGSPSPRWPSTRSAGRSTSTPSSAWTPPPTAAARPAWPRRPAVHRRAARARPSARPPRPWPCPARRVDDGQAVTLMPAGASSSTCATSPRPSDQEGELTRRAGGRLRRQVRDQGHRGLGVTLDHRVRRR